MNGIRKYRFAPIVALLALVGAAASVSTAHAITNADLRAGVYSDNGGVGLGGGGGRGSF